MFFKKKTKKGSVMIEVLVSLFIFGMGLAGATALISSAIHANSVNKNRIIALNLAREGIEAVRNMRDTNWMTWSANMRQCWNFWDNTDEDGEVDDDDLACNISVGDDQNNHPFGKLSDGNFVRDFIVDFDETNYRWALIPIPNSSSLSSELYLNNNNLYTHKPTGNIKTNFRRDIEITYIDNIDGDFPADPAKDNRILVKSTVTWQEENVSHEVVLAQTLTDYYARENYAD